MQEKIHPDLDSALLSPISEFNKNSAVLSTWKEIAAYMGKGVRTVQRWEQHLSLPVRHTKGRQGGSVYAMRQEIDSWLLNGGVRTCHGLQAENAELRQRILELINEVEKLKREALLVRSQAA